MKPAPIWEKCLPIWQNIIAVYWGPQQDLVEWGLMALEIALDEKAIAQVVPGDHLVVVNGLRKFKKIISITPTTMITMQSKWKRQEETLPVLFGCSHQGSTSDKKRLGHGCFKASWAGLWWHLCVFKTESQGFSMYVLFEEDLVMVSNDSLSLNDIRQNKMNAPGNKDFVKLMKQ